MLVSESKRKPALPVAVVPDRVQQSVVFVAVRLEEQAEIEWRPGQGAAGMQD